MECGDSEGCTCMECGCSVCVCLGIPPVCIRGWRPVCVKCPSVVMVDDHMCLTGQDMMEMAYVNADIRLDPDGELLPTDSYMQLRAAATRWSKHLAK